MKEANETTPRIVEGHRKTKAKLTNNIHAAATLYGWTPEVPCCEQRWTDDGVTQPFYQPQVPSLNRTKRERKKKEKKMSHRTKKKERKKKKKKEKKKKTTFPRAWLRPNAFNININLFFGCDEWVQQHTGECTDHACKYVFWWTRERRLKRWPSHWGRERERERGEEREGTNDEPPRFKVEMGFWKMRIENRMVTTRRITLPAEKSGNERREMRGKRARERKREREKKKKEREKEKGRECVCVVPLVPFRWIWRAGWGKWTKAHTQKNLSIRNGRGSFRVHR
jgi:hypothetical protein